MDKCRPLPTRAVSRSDGSSTSAIAAFNLLLVSRNADWFAAVTGAARTLGHGDVSACDARDALARLAGTTAHYSHLLVDQNAADGLMEELADVSIEVISPDTDMLVLGTVNTRHPHIRAISTATPRSVLEALMAKSTPRNRPVMDIAELRAALKGAMIETRYQPIVRIADRRPVGIEALVRLNHPQKGTLLPDRFVPQIEDAGLAAELTTIVSARAFADLAGPFVAGRGLRVSVNFPLDVLLMPSALDRLEEQRHAAGLLADRIVIELTESRPVDDIPMLSKSLERLRALGYGAAIDDVGPAVPRLAPLLDLPFTSLKLDKELVQKVLQSAEIEEFLAKTIAQAKAHDLTVVAEGVETDAIWDRMRQLGADQVQGFLAARPLPVAAIPVWWDSWVGRNLPRA